LFYLLLFPMMFHFRNVLLFFATFVLAKRSLVNCGIKGAEVRSAFCLEPYTNGMQNLFPTSTPPSDELPWVWDAIYEQDNSALNIITVPREACDFDVDMWKRFISLYPEYSGMLGTNSSTVFVSPSRAHGTNQTIKKRMRYSIQGERLVCLFYANGVEIASTKSHPVKMKNAFARIAPALVHCPVPAEHVKWDRVSLAKVSPAASVPALIPDADSAWEANHAYLTRNGLQATPTFPVCDVAQLQQENHQIAPTFAPPAPSPATQAQTLRFGFSICTATERGTRAELVEWLEYHVALGKDIVVVFCFVL
jgi:hypothetical protein